MASSVSSKHAFSSAGITITKCRNHLKGDIVEALQVLKCAIRTEFIVQSPMPSSILEQELEDGKDSDRLSESAKEEPFNYITDEGEDDDE